MPSSSHCSNLEDYHSSNVVAGGRRQCSTELSCFVPTDELSRFVHTDELSCFVHTTELSFVPAVELSCSFLLLS
ncbi:hypothetical protein TNCV_3979591 [Trichonephila clavipes]|nr:hypothetical protein TNCV_3979591 [Trichonephila clavipes]